MSSMGVHRHGASWGGTRKGLAPENKKRDSVRERIGADVERERIALGALTVGSEVGEQVARIPCAVVARDRGRSELRIWRKVAGKIHSQYCEEESKSPIRKKRRASAPSTAFIKET